MVFVSKLSKIIQVVKAFLDSMMEIASGAIGGGEQGRDHLSRFVDPRNQFPRRIHRARQIGEKVIGIIGKVRDTADKALDKAVDWIVSSAKTLFSKIFGKGDKPDERTDAQKKLISIGLSPKLRICNKRRTQRRTESEVTFRP